MSNVIKASFEFPEDRTDIAHQASLFFSNIARGRYREREPLNAKSEEGEELGINEGHPLDNTPNESLFEPKETKATTTVTPTAATPGKVDLKGVAFDPVFCADAKDPYYKSGATAGQWKKGKNVDPAAYGTWYAAQLALVPAHLTTDQGPAASAGVDTSTAFGPSGSATQTAEVAEAPADGGSLMIWISLKQNANLLTQNDVDQAYLTTGCDAGSLFGPTAASSVASIYGILAAKAGA